MSIEKRRFHRQPYLYVNAEAPMKDGDAIASAMGMAFGEVFAFFAQNGIAPLSAPLTVYAELPGDIMRFRAGAFVSETDAKKAAGEIRMDEIPECDVIYSQHQGAYSTLNKTHNAIWDHLKSNGLTPSMPVWEIYIDDPDDVPEDKLRTDVFHALI